MGFREEGRVGRQLGVTRIDTDGRQVKVKMGAGEACRKQA